MGATIYDNEQDFLTRLAPHTVGLTPEGLCVLYPHSQETIWKYIFVSLEVDTLDHKWKELFALIGVTNEEMQKKETRDFIYDFVEKQGGIDNVIRELNKEKAIPSPAPRKQ